MRRLVTDTLVIAERNLVRLPRAPELLLAFTVQPIMFVLLFRYVFGGAIKTPGYSYADFLIPGIIVQIIMSSRVLYGLARQGNLPAGLGAVSKVTRTPLLATALTSTLVLLFALLLPLQHLADLTARMTLVVFALVNASLIRIKARERPMDGHVPVGFVAPAWVPWAGCVSCAALLILDLSLMV